MTKIESYKKLIGKITNIISNSDPLIEDTKTWGIDISVEAIEDTLKEYHEAIKSDKLGTNDTPKQTVIEDE